MDNTPVYTLTLKSTDKIQGYNNDAFFLVNWRDFLPEKYNRYNTIFNFNLCEPGYYTNNTNYTLTLDVSGVSTAYTYNYGPELTQLTYAGFDTGEVLIWEDTLSSSYTTLFAMSNLRAYFSFQNDNASLLNMPGSITRIDNDAGALVFGSLGDNAINLYTPSGQNQTHIYVYSQDHLIRTSDLTNSTKTLMYNVSSDYENLYVNTITNIFIGQYVKIIGQAIDFTVHVIYINGNYVHLNKAIGVNALAGSQVIFFNCDNPPTDIYTSISYTNEVNYDSARIETNFYSRSYSFQTSNLCQSLILGNINRDVSNVLKSDINSNPPKTIARPSNNLLNIRILNNMKFAYGLLSHNPEPNYSMTPTNTNLLTDTNSAGTTMITTKDMTDWILNILFIPIENDIRKNQYEL